MGFLQAEAKRQFFTEDFIKLGLQTVLTQGSELGRMAFFHLTFSIIKVQGKLVQLDTRIDFGTSVAQGGMQAGKQFFIEMLACLKCPLK